MVFAPIFFFIAALIVLIASGSWLVKSAAKISIFLRVPEFITGFILMAVATSLPELFVGITSAVNQNPALSLGTVIGSNIANLTIIIGIGIVLARNVKIHTEGIRSDSLFMLAISVFPFLLMFIGKTISRIDAVILLLLYGTYYFHIFKRRKLYSRDLRDGMSRKEGVFYTFLFVLSLSLLFLSANWTVVYGTELAEELNFPPILIGLFLIAIGTSLPELVFGIQAMLKGHSEMSLGNIIGSNITNSGLVLGVTALIYPIEANFVLFSTAAVYMVLVSLIFTAFIESKNFSRISGISLIVLYLFFLFIEIYVKALQG